MDKNDTKEFVYILKHCIKTRAKYTDDEGDYPTHNIACPGSLLGHY